MDWKRYCGNKFNRRLKKKIQIGLVTIVLAVCVYSTLRKSYPPAPLVDKQIFSTRLIKSHHQEALLLGNPKSEKVFLTIGIPTACRQNGESYLQGTLDSIINSTEKADFLEMKLIVAVSDTNYTCRRQIKSLISKYFKAYLDSGFIELIGVPVWYYPPLHNLRRTFNDEEFRVFWRSKQNVDFSFLMAYSQSKSRYYLQIEDDVTAAKNFLKTIKEYIKESTGYWAVLEFSSLGFIGKLIKAEDLHKLSQFLLTFYAEQPCDYLLMHFMNLMVQKEQRLKIPTIFQHRGLHSSLPNFTRNVSDKFFNIGVRKYKGDNPPAQIYTSLRAYKDNTPEKAYNKDQRGFFWSLHPSVGDTIVIKFKDAQCLKRIVIDSGFANTGTDIIESAVVEIGEKVVKTDDGNLLCLGLKYLGEIENKSFDKRNVNTKKCEFADQFSSCVKITFTRTQTQWLLIKEFAVFIV